jgi:Ni/Co efflux regulator RcnB
MKRILLTGLAALTLTGAIAESASAQPFDRGHDRRDNNRGRFEQGRYDNQFNRNWRRGDRLPGGWQNRYRGVDYRAYNLRPAPYGYRWVRDDRSGGFLLVGLATGVILGSILSN